MLVQCGQPHHLVLLGGEDGRLARLVHRDVLDVDDGPGLKLGRGFRKMDIENGLQYNKIELNEILSGFLPSQDLFSRQEPFRLI